MIVVFTLAINCQAIASTSIHTAEIKTDSIFPIGTKWTYEWMEFGFPNYISYVEFEVIDTLRSNDSLIYIIANNRTHPEIKMYQGSDKVYLFDPFTKGWQLTYNFASDNTYDTYYYDPLDDMIKLTTVDVEVGPDLTIDLGDRGVVPIQKVTITENGSQDTPLQFDIVSKVGKIEGGLALELGQALHDPPYFIGHIRCFEQGDFNFNFSSNGSGELVPCDWEQDILSTHNPLSNTIHVYPNPTFDILFINRASTEVFQYKIYSVEGILRDHGTCYKQIDVSKIPSGLHLIKIGEETLLTKVFFKH